MKTLLLLLACVLGLSGTFLGIKSAAANDPGYAYEVLPGIQPADSPTDVTLTESWHPLPYAEDLTGPCLPRRPRTVVRHDLLVLALDFCPLPSTTLSYGAPTTSGSVTDAGDYAFLSDPDDLTTLVTTYEGLRDGTTTGLVLHQSDRSGTSQAALYNLVRTGDLVEWRQAGDCFVRYTVTEVKSDPTGDPLRKLLAVAWMTYAFTGCSGAISSTATASLQWGPLPNLGGTSLTAPVVHGSFQIVPAEWDGVVESDSLRPPPDALVARIDEIHATWTDYARTIERAQALPYWRTPRLPDDWQFRGAGVSPTIDPWGYIANWKGPLGDEVDIDGTHAQARRHPEVAVHHFPEGDFVARETRVIAGRPAVVHYKPSPVGFSLIIGIVYIYDPAADAEYRIFASGGPPVFSGIDDLIAIAASLFEAPNPP